MSVKLNLSSIDASEITEAVLKEKEEKTEVNLKGIIKKVEKSILKNSEDGKRSCRVSFHKKDSEGNRQWEITKQIKLVYWDEKALTLIEDQGFKVSVEDSESKDSMTGVETIDILIEW